MLLLLCASVLGSLLFGTKTVDQTGRVLCVGAWCLATFLLLVLQLEPLFRPVAVGQRDSLRFTRLLRAPPRREPDDDEEGEKGDEIDDGIGSDVDGSDVIADDDRHGVAP